MAWTDFSIKKSSNIVDLFRNLLAENYVIFLSYEKWKKRTTVGSLFRILQEGSLKMNVILYQTSRAQVRFNVWLIILKCCIVIYRFFNPITPAVSPGGSCIYYYYLYCFMSDPTGNIGLILPLNLREFLTSSEIEKYWDKYNSYIQYIRISLYRR